MILIFRPNCFFQACFLKVRLQHPHRPGIGHCAYVGWAANKSFEVLKFNFKFPRARTFELFRARSRLYRSQILQVKTRWKALAEIYTMHSFAPFWNPLAKNGEKRAWPKQPRKGDNERPFSSSSLPSTSAKGGCAEKLTRMKIECANDIWSPNHLCTVL